MERLSDRGTITAFAAATLIGGTNFVAVRISNEGLPPQFGAAMRFSLAAALFLAIAAVRRVTLPRGRDAAGAVLYGVLAFGVLYAFVYYALTALGSGTVSVIMAGAPLFTLVVAVLIGQERLTLRGVLGGALAVAGIAVLSSGSLGRDIGWTYLAAAVVASMSAGASSVVAKAHQHVSPVAMNAVGMVSGAILLATATIALGEQWRLPSEPRTWLALGWLVIFGSVGLFLLVLHVIRRWTASAAVYSVAAMPVVAVVLDAIVLGQPITAHVVAGGALMALAVYIGALADGGRKARGAEAVASATAERAPLPTGSTARAPGEALERG